MQPTLTRERCSNCAYPLVAWPYMAADGEMMFNPNTGVPLVIVEGDGEVQQRAALICAKCDRTDLMPRRDAP